jgi:glycosyltransferase involved in cell wall biosynthesis
MHILMLCAAAPTPERPRTHGLLTALAQRGHAVDLIFIDRAGTAFDTLSERCRTITPVRRYGLAHSVLGALARRPFDLVHLEGSLVGAVGTPLPLPSVIDMNPSRVAYHEHARGVSGVALQAMRVLQALRVRYAGRGALADTTRLIMAGAEHAWPYGVQDETAHQSDQVPTPVDLERFTPQLRLRDQATMLLDLRDFNHLERMAALSEARAMMTRLWAVRPELMLHVLGAPPLGATRALAREPRIHLLGAVRDARPYLAAATLAVAPLLPGGAAPYAPLEALAMGLPLLGPPALARHLAAMPGHELATAADRTQMVQTALDLLDDAPYRGRLGRAGRRLVELHHSYEATTLALEDVYAAATGSAIAEWRLAVGLERACGV